MIKVSDYVIQYLEQLGVPHMSCFREAVPCT